MLQHLITRFSPTLLISTLLLATYLAQQHASPLIFLPVGVQLLACFVYGVNGLPGCIIGMGLGTALLAHHSLNVDTFTIQTAYGALSTLGLLWFIRLICRANHINHELAGLGYRHILIVAGLQSVYDALLHIVLMPTSEHSTGIQFLAQVTGNLLGSMAVVLTLLVFANLHHRRA